MMLRPRCPVCGERGARLVHSPGNCLRVAMAFACTWVLFDPIRLWWRCPRDNARFLASGSQDG